MTTDDFAETEQDVGDEAEDWWKPDARQLPPSLSWIAPVRGVHPPVDSRPYEVNIAPVILQKGLVWRSTTDRDRADMDAYWELFRDGYAKALADSMRWSHTLLAWDDPGPAEVVPHPGPVLLCFLVAASLHKRVSVRSLWLRFEHRADGIHPHSGLPEVMHTCHLQTWPERSVVVTDDDRSQIAETYSHVRQCLIDNQTLVLLRRAIGAYRAAAMSVFVEATAILLCASLESLVGTQKKEDVIDWLVTSYSSSDDRAADSAAADDLFTLRNDYVHGVTHRGKFVDPNRRFEALDSGLTLTKKVLLSALRDSELLKSGASHREVVRRLFARRAAEDRA